MQATQKIIVKELLLAEEMARGFLKQCHKARRLMEEGVSTPSKSQKALSEDQLKVVSMKRKQRILRK